MMMSGLAVVGLVLLLVIYLLLNTLFFYLYGH